MTRQEAAPVRRSTAENITGIVDSPREARQAETCLTDEGFARDAITIMSAEPLAEFISELGSKSPGRAGMLSIAGGIAGAGAAIALTVWTSRRMGLVTGGMPIITPWAFGIIVYELIALGAILTTFVVTIYEAGLLRRGAIDVEVDSAIADGKVAVSVSCQNDTSRRVAESVFSKLGAKICGNNG